MLLGLSRDEFSVLTATRCRIELIAWGAHYDSFSVYIPVMEDQLGGSLAFFPGILTRPARHRLGSFRRW